MDYPGKVITKTQVTPTQTSASGNWTLDDQAAAIKNNNWPVALVPNPISKSLRFNNADSAYLNRTPASAGNRKTWTWSGWIKRSEVGSNGIFSSFDNSTGGTDVGTAIRLLSANLDIFDFTNSTYNFQLVTTQVFRDLSAWYHIVVAFDTTQATASNRVKLYVNGSQVTAFSTATYPNQNTDWGINNTVVHGLGCISVDASPQQYFPGYMTEVNFIDGQALTPSDFGLTNPQTGQWIPKKYTGTYGTNGFYLNFKDATSTTTLGYDYSGNANNWTTNNFSVTAGSGNDSLTDVPTPWVAYNTTGDVGGVVRGNYATWNGALPATIAGPSIVTISNGNLDVALLSNVVGDLFLYSTTLLSSGKWYYEFTISATTNNGHGIGASGASFSQLSGNSYAIYRWQSGVVFVNTGNVTTGLPTCTTNDVIGVAIDVGAGTIQWFKNNTSLYTATGLTYSTYIPLIYGDAGTGRTFSGTTNFGQRPFAYTPPAGFRSLCTTNLPATTIGFGLTNQANKYFDVSLWTGNGTSLSITNSGSMKPDFVWYKRRSTAAQNGLFDSVRGTTKYLASDTTDAESTVTGVTSFNSDGFTVGDAPGGNSSGGTFVGWQWRASNATAVTNTAGTITSTVSASTTAGFSVVTYTGTGSNATVGHGLGAVPRMIIIKGRDTAYNWRVYHASLGNTGGIFLNTTAAFTSTSGYWNDTTPTSTVFTIGTDAGMNQSAATYVAYCFAPVAGYSAFGSYTGNGSTDGPFVYLGFRPAFVMVKVTSTTDDWIIEDNKRNTYNPEDAKLSPNLSSAEVTGSTYYVDFLSNGFKLRNTNGLYNTSSATYVYAAFAESPFQFANAR